MSMRKLYAVPPDWEHPTDEDGNYIPTHMELFDDALARWKADELAWIEKRGEAYELCKDYHERGWTWAQVDDDAPEANMYRQRKWTEEEATHFQWYEEVSEGTPVSPILETLEEANEWWEMVGKFQGIGSKINPDGAPPSKWIPSGGRPGAKLHFSKDGSYSGVE